MEKRESMGSMTLANHTVIRARDNVVACDLDGGQAILDLDSSQYFKLNATASVVWEAIRDNGSIDDAVRSIMAQYDVDEDQCRRDATAIVQEFERADLIEISDKEY